MQGVRPLEPQRVHCRIGSLEITGSFGSMHGVVHCRIGSLESVDGGKGKDGKVHCRIGSLEMYRLSRHRHQ